MSSSKTEARPWAGRPERLRAASFPYAHLPHRSLWRSMLDRLHALGFNAVLIPFPWSYHSPAPGFHDVLGPRDIPALLAEVARAGLWLIPHIGPWLAPALSDGGIPCWCTAYWALREGQVSPPLLRSARDAVAAWWGVLLPLLRSQPNLALCVLDPGLPAEAPGTLPLTHDLLTLAHEQELPIPYLLPYTLQRLLSGSSDALPTRPFVLHRLGEALPSRLEAAMIWITAPGGRPLAAEAHATALMEGLTSRWEHFPVVALSALHRLSPWGCLYAGLLVPPGDQRLAPPLELTARSGLCAAVKRALFQAETLRVLARGGAVEQIEGPSAVGGRDEPYGVGGTPAHLDTPWALRYGQVLQSALRPLLHLTVARRELLVVENRGGETLVIEGILSRPRMRGHVRVTALGQARYQVTFGEAPLETVVFSTPEGPLQILALSPVLAARLWPLDDLWRTASCHTSHWTAASDQPTRGLIVGPEMAVPGEDTAYTCAAVVQGKGYGYRWGPWRGSDPLTWLAPFYWDDPAPFALPALTWEQRAGVPEVLPDYDDATWQAVSLPLTLEPGSELARNCGLFWLRASFTGRPGSLILRLPADGDLFLNGVLVASLTTPLPGGAAGEADRTIPLPARYLQERNVLAILADVGWLMRTPPSLFRPRYALWAHLEGAGDVTWKQRWGILGQVARQGFADFANWRWVDGGGGEAVTWYRSLVTLNLPEGIETPVFLSLESLPRQALVYLNGVLLRRLDRRRSAVERIWLPDGLLKRAGCNEILIAQWARGARPGIPRARLETGPVAQVIVRRLPGR